jgi:hypothetical protein
MTYSYYKTIYLLNPRVTNSIFDRLLAVITIGKHEDRQESHLGSEVFPQARIMDRQIGFQLLDTLHCAGHRL